MSHNGVYAVAGGSGQGSSSWLGCWKSKCYNTSVVFVVRFPPTVTQWIPNTILHVAKDTKFRWNKYGDNVEIRYTYIDVYYSNNNIWCRKQNSDVMSSILATCIMIYSDVTMVRHD